VLLTIMQPRLTLTAIGVVPVVVITAMFFGRRLRRLTTGVQDKVADATAVADEAMSQIRTVQSFVQEDAERARYGARIMESVRSALLRAHARGIFFGVLTLATFCGIVIVLWQGGRLVLEGGGLEGNGRGALLVTEEWLLSDVQVRNPGLDRAGYERAFRDWLGIRETIWLGEGCVGDDTHGHVDDIARFVAPGVVVLAYEDDPADDENHRRSVDNMRRLELAGAARGTLKVVRIPFPRAVTMNGERLPASYANFYVANGVVLVPTFNDLNDRVALNAIAELMPDRHVVGIHAVDLVWGFGTLHCLTQQQPAPR
jgi:hypothetical protein